MSYSTPKSNYSSLKYRRRGTRQPRSYENTPSDQENAAEYQDTSLLPPKFRSSSLRLPHAISHNLISLVSRFEALDALSLPFKHSSPQMASSRGSRNSPARRVGAHASHRTNLSTLFLPSMNRSLPENPYIFSEDDFPSGRDDIFISSDSNSPLRLSPTKLNSRYIGKAQSSSKLSSTRLRGGDWGACQATANNISGKDKAPNESSNSKDVTRSIRDIIRLYDGTMSRGSTTKALNSFISSLTPMTPTTAKYPNDNQRQLSTSTRNTNRIFASTQADVPTTPTKTFQSTAARQPNLNFRSAPPNVFDNRNFEAKPPSAHISPRTLDKEREGRNRPLVAANGTPGRGQSNLPFDQTKQNASSETIKKIPAEDRGRRMVATTRKASPPGLNYRRISDKIEQLYRATNLERDNKLRDAVEKKEMVHNVVPSRKNIRFIGQGCTTRETKLDTSLRVTPSKVADMKKIFDASDPLEAKDSPQRLPQFRPLFSTIPGLAECEKSKVDRPLLSPPILDPLLQVNPKTSSAISSKTMREKLATDTGVKPPAPVNIGTFQRLYPRKRESRPKSKIIGEKIKIFEGTIESKQIAEPQKGDYSFTRKIRSSMQSFFEAPSNSMVDKERSARRDKGFNGRGVKNFVEEIEVEKLSAGTKVGKRETMGGRRSMIPKISAASCGDGTMSDVIASPSVEAVSMMVIKEAECGLKQPKPLRVVEMKRMMALCRRDRVGGIMEREKGRIVLTRKL